MITPGDVGVSTELKLRPWRIETPSVSKYSDETRATSMTSALSFGPWRSGRNTALRL